MYLLVHIDDIVITGSSSKEGDHLIKTISCNFKVKTLGNLSFFLGIEVTKTPRGIQLSQQQYIIDILCLTNMLQAKPTPTPMVVGPPLSVNQGKPLPNGFEYRSTVGK